MSKEDMWVCNWCGSEEVYETVYVPMNYNSQAHPPMLDMDQVIYPKNEEHMSKCNCNGFESPLQYEEWCKKIFEETMGNKEEYHKILDGGRM